MIKQGEEEEIAAKKTGKRCDRNFESHHFGRHFCSVKDLNEKH